MTSTTQSTPPLEDHQADRDSRHAAIALGTTLPGDTVLYLLLPMFAASFGVSLAEAGLLLAANRLVRIAGYGWVVRFYARHGDRATCLLAVLAAAGCALGYATLSGFWWLLPLRLVWGLCFAALNLVTQALSTALARNSASRSGRSRAFIAAGPVLALPAGALLTQYAGPRAIFHVLAVVALCGLLAAHRLPRGVEALPPPTRRGPRLPNALDSWSFLEGFTLDGLFIIGLSFLGQELLPGGAVLAAGVLLALRYGGEIVLSPLGGRMAERWGAERLLVAMSLLTCVALVGFGCGWLWSCAGAIVVLRALQLPLIAPIVAHRYPGPARVQALAARSVWRDIGAGTGPLVAGLMLPIVSSAWLYGISAALLALAALACGRESRGRAAA
ncbi:MFS transporter [Xylophilus rhododendri]|uniref:MFS transporter n=1 Tax=Xylophilus rhododendri TaxID=2697032 RepID=A0A857JB79_9BURK|nr:MFS transporter [Xylophilus rhododendri]QHJ00233.1 MFS transporter [Xylophilus rhododendri]